MKAGLEQFRVGKFVPANESILEKPQSYIQLDLPPAGQELAAAEYHNRLMKLCQVSLAQVLDAVQRRAEKRKPEALTQCVTMSTTTFCSGLFSALQSSTPRRHMVVVACHAHSVPVLHVSRSCPRPLHIRQAAAAVPAAASGAHAMSSGGPLGAPAAAAASAAAPGANAGVAQGRRVPLLNLSHLGFDA